MAVGMAQCTNVQIHSAIQVSHVVNKFKRNKGVESQ